MKACANIIGQLVTRVLQSPWRRAYRAEYCDVFVELGGGRLFQLTNRGPLPVQRDLEPERGLITADFRNARPTSPCAGEAVVRLVQPDRELQWDSCGLLLSSGRLLCLAGHGSSFGPQLLEPGDLRPGTEMLPLDPGAATAPAAQ